MAVTAIVGTGTTLTFSGFTYKLLEIGGPDISREPIPASKMSTTVAHEFLPATLVDSGVVSGRVEADGTVPSFGATATLTITFPNAAARSCSAFLTKFNTSTPLEDKMTAEFEFKCTGAWS